MLIKAIVIEQMVADRGIDWLIDNTQKIIIRYSKYQWDKKNEIIVARYSELLNYLYSKKNGILWKNKYKNKSFNHNDTQWKE